MMKTKKNTIQVVLSEAELAGFPQGSSNSARVRLQCGLEPLQRGGQEAGKAALAKYNAQRRKINKNKH